MTGTAVRKVNDTYQVRATAKAGNAGIFVDLAGVRRLSADCTVSMSVTVGLQARVAFVTDGRQSRLAILPL